MLKQLQTGLLAGLVAVLCSSCLFSRFIYTDKQLEEEYSRLSFRPSYHTTQYKDYRLHYAEFGDRSRPLLLLIHGAPGAWYGYRNFTNHDSLRKYYHIIAVDRLGYGKSEYGKAVLSIEDQAMAVKQVIDEQASTDSVTIVGRSYGAPIGGLLAARYPEKVKRLIMVSPVIHPTKEKFYWFSPIARWRIIRWMFPKSLNVATREKYGHTRELQKHVDMWQHIQCPTTVLAGGKDWIADPVNFCYADSVLSNCTKEMIYLENSGHYITGERGSFVIDLILNQSEEGRFRVLD